MKGTPTRTLNLGAATDAELVRLSVLGSPEAFDGLVRRYRAMARAIAAGVTHRAETVEDAVQDGFLLAFKNLPKLQDPERFAPWLAAIVRNRAVRAAGREARQEPTDHDALDRLLLDRWRSLRCPPDRETLDRLGAEDVHQAIENLPEDYAAVLRLYYEGEHSVRDIGEFLSLPITTVKWRLHQGRQWLRRRLPEPEANPQ